MKKQEAEKALKRVLEGNHIKLYLCLLGHDIDKWDFVIARHDDEAREIFSKMQEYYNECPEDYTITPLPNTIMSSYIQSVKFDDVPEVQLQLQINDLV